MVQEDRCPKTQDAPPLRLTKGELVDGEQVAETIEDPMIIGHEDGQEAAAHNLAAATDDAQTYGAELETAIDPGADAARCWCGAAMPAARTTGRRRRHCTVSCRRRRNAAVKRLRRLEDALAAWRAEEGGATYTPADIDQELWELRADLLPLLQLLVPAPSLARNERCDREAAALTMEGGGSGQ